MKSMLFVMEHIAVSPYDCYHETTGHFTIKTAAKDITRALHKAKYARHLPAFGQNDKSESKDGAAHNVRSPVFTLALYFS